MTSAVTAQQGSCCSSFARRMLRMIEKETGLQLGDHDAWLLKARVGQAGALAPSVPHAAPCTLQFVHSCRYTACTELGCELCRNNPHKACRLQLRPKYVVGQEISAPCGAALRIAFAPSTAAGASGAAEAQQQWEALRASGARLQLLLVDEKVRQQRAKQLLLAGASTASNLEVAALLRETTVAFDPAGKPMLSCSSGGTAANDGSLILDLKGVGDNGVPISGLTVGCSTERATSGRKRAPVRLAAVLVDADGDPRDAAPILSPEFYVVSDRAENHELQSWLLLDSPVSAVRTIGKETARRLADLPAACESSGTKLQLPRGVTSVTTVRELGKLLFALRNQPAALSQVLKISKAQLEAAAAHVATAVDPDSFLRALLAPGGTALVFTCQQGGCHYAEPAAIMRYERGSGGEVKPLAVQKLGAAEAAEQLKEDGPLRELWAQAEAAWQAPRHEGWVVLEIGGKKFESYAELEAVLPREAKQSVLPQLAAEYAARQAAQHKQAQGRRPETQQPKQAQQTQRVQSLQQQLSSSLAAAAAAQTAANTTARVQLFGEPMQTDPAQGQAQSQAPAAKVAAASLQCAASFEPEGGALAAAGQLCQLPANLATQTSSNPFALAAVTAAVTGGAPAGAAAGAVHTRTGTAADGGGMDNSVSNNISATNTNPLKRQNSSCSGGDGQQAQQAQQNRVVRPRASPLPRGVGLGLLLPGEPCGTATPVDRQSLDSTSLPSLHASQGSHVAALSSQQQQQQPQQQPLPSTTPPQMLLPPLQLPEQQQQPVQRLMPSVPRAPFESRVQQDQQQLEILNLLQYLSQQQQPPPPPPPPPPLLLQQGAPVVDDGTAAARALFSLGLGTLGSNHANSLTNLVQRLTSSLSGFAHANAGGSGGVGGVPTFSALPNLPLEFWTPSLEQLAQLFNEDHSIPLVPLPLPNPTS